MYWPKFIPTIDDCIRAFEAIEDWDEATETYDEILRILNEVKIARKLKANNWQDPQEPFVCYSDKCTGCLPGAEED